MWGLLLQYWDFLVVLIRSLIQSVMLFILFLSYNMSGGSSVGNAYYSILRLTIRYMNLTLISYWRTYCVCSVIITLASKKEVIVLLTVSYLLNSLTYRLLSRGFEPKLAVVSCFGIYVRFFIQIIKIKKMLICEGKHREVFFTLNLKQFNDLCDVSLT